MCIVATGVMMKLIEITHRVSALNKAILALDEKKIKLMHHIKQSEDDENEMKFFDVERHEINLIEQQINELEKIKKEVMNSW